MTRYTMTTNAKGAADETGASITVYRQGETYVLPRAVAAAFVGAGYCRAADAPAEPEPAAAPEPATDEPKPTRKARK